MVSNDVLRVEFVRRAVGDDFILVGDANRAWTVEQALEFARSVADLNIGWLEEPVRWHNEVEGMRRVRGSHHCQGISMRSNIGASRTFGL